MSGATDRGPRAPAGRGGRRPRPDRPTGPGARARDAAAAAALAAAVAAGPAGAQPARLERALPILPEGALLGGSDGELALPLRLPPGEPVARAELTLAYDNALAVLPDGSRISVWLNGRPLAELPLAAGQAPLAARVEIPGHLFVPGPNRLAFKALARHRLGCSRAAADELWVRIRGPETRLRVWTEPAARPPAAAIDGLLAASFHDGEPVAIASARPVGDPTALAWGAALAQGVALRRGERALVVEDLRLPPPGGGPAGAAASPGLGGFAGRNLVLVGTRGELAPALAELGVAPPDGPVGAARLPRDPAHLAIVVTGPDAAAVDAAVRAFAAPGPAAGGPAPDAAHAAAALPVPAGPAAGGGLAPGGDGGGPVLRPASEVTLRDLGYATRDSALGATGRHEVELEFPPTLYAGDGQELALELDYAYRPGLAPTSSLLVLVNGAPWNMLRLDRAGGALVEGERVGLPMGLFRPGRNKIAFEPVLELPAGAPCPPAEAAAFSLFEDSRVTVPRFAGLAVQPDLGRLADAAFPFGPEVAGPKEAVVTARDSATVGAAWTLLAKLAQARGAPLEDVAVGFAATSPERHLLVVGPVGRLPPHLAASVPAGLARADAAPAARAAGAGPAAGPPVAAPAAGPGPAGSGRELWAQRLRAEAGTAGGTDPVRRLLARLGGPAAQAAAGPPGAAAAAGGAAGAWDDGAPRDAALLAFRSPYRDDRTVFVVTADDARALERAVGRLVRPELWGRLEGASFRWDSAGGGAGAAAVAVPAAATYLIEPPRAAPRELALLAKTYLSRHTAAWLGVAFGLLAALGLATRHAARRRLEHRL